MVTLNSADGALKSFYLDAVTETLNNKINPFLAKIEKTSSYVVGKDVRKVIANSFNGGIGAGTEAGDLPQAKDRQRNQIVVPLKNFYGTIEISDKAVRAAATNDGAFVNLLNDEMQSLINSAKFNFGRMLFGDGSGSIGSIALLLEGGVQVEDIYNFVPDMYIDIIKGSNSIENVRITKVDYKGKSISLDYTNATGTLDENYQGACIYMHGPKDCELTGLAAIFLGDSLYGLNRDLPGMRALVNDDGLGIDEMTIQRMIDDIELNSGARPNLILCSNPVRRALLSWYRNAGLTPTYVKWEDGSTVLSVCGLPVVVDRFCQQGSMYILNTDYFKLYQLCDWQWLESDDGKILKQVAGKPVYTATLVKYAELVCELPAAQGLIMDIATE